MSRVDWLLLITLSIIWGGSFFFNEIAVAELPTFTIVVARVALAAAILWAVLRATGQPVPNSWPVWFAFLGMGFLNNVVPFTLIVWGQSQIASGLASILNATTPLFTVLVAHWLTSDETLTPTRLIGVAIGMLGVAVMVGGDALLALSGSVLGQLACLGAAISYAFAGVFGRRFKAMGVSPMATAAGQVTASSLLLLPFMLVIDQPWTLPLPSTQAIVSVIGLAALCTALAYILFFRILASAGATNLSLVTFLVPVSAILLGVLVLGERLEAQHMLGMMAIGCGLIAIDGRLLNRRA